MSRSVIDKSKIKIIDSIALFAPLFIFYRIFLSIALTRKKLSSRLNQDLR